MLVRIVIESPWMPLNPFEVESYPPGKLANKNTLHAYQGCGSILQTYVIQATGKIGSCCGIGMRVTPELNVADVGEEDFLEKAVIRAENDFLKTWLHYKGPEKILAWAAEKNPNIIWEDMYAHRCQACLRLYKDPIVKQVVREHYPEMLSEVMATAYLADIFMPYKFMKTRDKYSKSKNNI